MTRRGPAPTPKEILKLRGSWRGNDAPDDAKAESGEPAFEDGLHPLVKDVWAQVVPLLLGMGVLGTIDGKALARYCQYWIRWRECEEFISKHGMTYPMYRGKGDGKEFMGLAEYPQVKRSQALSAELRRLEQEFGMTPSARSRVTVDVKPPKSSIQPRKRG